MTKTQKQTQASEKNRLIGRLTYLPYGSNGHGSEIGPVFSTSRGDCRQVLVESIPLALVRDLQRGEVGSFFLWDRKEEAGA